MASNKTPNLNLDVWAEMDFFKRAELNTNFDKVDGVVGDIKSLGDNPKSLAQSIRDFGANIVNFGADPTGVKDSNVAIQKAIDSGVKDVYVPDGLFTINLDSITYSGKGTRLGIKLRDNLRVFGTGTLKLKEGIGGNFAVMANPNDSIKNCIIEGITIDGNKTNSTGTQSNLIFLEQRIVIFAM